MGPWPAPTTTSVPTLPDIVSLGCTRAGPSIGSTIPETVNPLTLPGWIRAAFSLSRTPPPTTTPGMTGQISPINRNSEQSGSSSAPIRNPFCGTGGCNRGKPVACSGIPAARATA